MIQAAPESCIEETLEDFSHSPDVRHLIATTVDILRQPLESAEGLLQRCNDEPRAWKPLIAEVERQLKEMGQRLNALSAFAPRPHRGAERSDLLNVIWEHISRIHPQNSEKDIGWNVVTMVDDLEVAVPARVLGQVIGYLVQYLLDTASYGGRLRVCVDLCEEADPLLSIRQYISCTFEQGGVDMRQVDPSAFTDPSNNGVVFGLTLCQNTLQHYGYSLRFFRGSQGAARFVIMVPTIAEGKPSIAGDPQLI